MEVSERTCGFGIYCHAVTKSHDPRPGFHQPDFHERSPVPAPLAGSWSQRKANDESTSVPLPVALGGHASAMERRQSMDDGEAQKGDDVLHQRTAGLQPRS